MASVFPRVCTLALILAAVTRCAADEHSTRVQIVKAGKAATALVEVKARQGEGYGSAFCVHPAGWFVTNAHVAVGSLTLVLNPNLKNETSYPARVVRTDKEVDLALLKVESVTGLPSLSLGSEEGLDELTEVMGFGYPLTKVAGREISVSVGRITALRHKDGKLEKLQLDAALSRGSSGGPVLDKDGKVVGVVVSGIVATGLSFAIPVSVVAQFLARPEVQFDPPALSPGNLHKPVTFEARVAHLIPSSASLTVELILKAGKAPERTLRMDAQEDRYRVTTVPIPAPTGPWTLRLAAHFDNATLEASTSERSLRIGGREVKLSAVRTIFPGSPSRVVLRSGETIIGDVIGLDAVQARLSGQTMSVDLASAKDVNVSPMGEAEKVECTLVVRQGENETFRKSQGLGGAEFYLCDLKETQSSVGTGMLGKNGDLGYDPGGGAARLIIVKGVLAKKGLSMHATSRGYSFARYELDGKYSSLRSAVAVNDSVRVALYPGRGIAETPLTFSVLGDGRELWKSRPLQGPGESEPCTVDVTGVRRLELRVYCDSAAAAHAVWVDPYVQ